MQDSWHKYVAEAVGTFALVFIIAGAALANAQGAGGLGDAGVALAGGLGLAALIYSAWHISGAHFNPAVTVALWATGQVKSLLALGYIAAQLIGAVLAAVVLKFVFASVSPQYFLGDTMLVGTTSPVAGIVMEAIVTFIFVWVIFGALVDKKAHQGFGALAVGLSLSALMMVASSTTMGALNPARSFGPALVSSHWVTHYVYWVGPVVGGLLAGLTYRFGFMKKG